MKRCTCSRHVNPSLVMDDPLNHLRLFRPRSVSRAIWRWGEGRGLTGHDKSCCVHADVLRSPCLTCDGRSERLDADRCLSLLECTGPTGVFYFASECFFDVQHPWGSIRDMYENMSKGHPDVDRSSGHSRLEAAWPVYGILMVYSVFHWGAHLTR